MSEPVSAVSTQPEASSDYCTAAMYGRNNTTGSLIIITAGHCVYDLASNTTWYNGANLVGQQYSWIFGPGGDLGEIRVIANDSGSRNRVMRSTPSDWVNIGYEKPISQQVIGTSVCRSSAVLPNWNCGTIGATDQTLLVCSQDGANCRNVSHLWRMSFTSSPGASGGPTLYGSTIFGVVSAKNPSYTWYVPTEYMTFADVCLTTEC
ncbi:MAG: hypothetical protein M0T75_10705 [Chloroflexi bacterium]|nr:hypothetical protein [Chloroflexota bacterium]